MKVALLSMILSIGTAVFADPSIYQEEDENSGLVMETTGSLDQTWEADPLVYQEEDSGLVMEIAESVDQTLEADPSIYQDEGWKFALEVDPSIYRDEDSELVMEIAESLDQTWEADPSIYRDEDSGLVMEIPQGLDQTWEITNFETGIEIKIFNSKEEEEENFSVVVIAKCPINSANNQERMAALYPQLLEQVQGKCGETGLGAEVENLSVDCALLPSVASEQVGAIRFRVHVSGLDEADEVFIDVHAFIMGEYSIGVATCVYPCASEERLEDFSTLIASSIRYISDSAE